MANIQKYFEEFHNKIRTDYDMNDELREKRDVVIGTVKKYLKEQGHPSCEELLQGSFRVGTGIKPIEDLEYDIDVGLRFCFRDSEHTAKDVRRWVFQSVEGHTGSVVEMGPCTRVNYATGFHIDLVAYSTWDENGQTQYRLAHNKNGWRHSDPPALIAYVKKIREQFKGTEDSATSTDQFRRVVRYLKRWNDEAIPTDQEYKASGIALLVLAAHHLAPRQSWDGVSEKPC